MEEKQTTSGGIGLTTLVFLVFLTLKLAGIGTVATWSWWWVTAPLWIPIALVLAIVAIALPIAVVNDRRKLPR